MSTREVQIMTTDGVTAHLPISMDHTACGQTARVQPRTDAIAVCVACARTDVGRTCRADASA